MTRTHSPNRREFISNGLAASGALALGISSRDLQLRTPQARGFATVWSIWTARPAKESLAGDR
jgi:hypothetical protein